MTEFPLIVARDHPKRAFREGRWVTVARAVPTPATSTEQAQRAAQALARALPIGRPVVEGAKVIFRRPVDNWEHMGTIQGVEDRFNVLFNLRFGKSFFGVPGHGGARIMREAVDIRWIFTGLGANGDGWACFIPGTSMSCAVRRPYDSMQYRVWFNKTGMPRGGDDLGRGFATIGAAKAAAEKYLRQRAGESVREAIVRWEDYGGHSDAVYRGVTLTVHPEAGGWAAKGKEGMLPVDVIGSYGTREQAKAGAERWAKKNYGESVREQSETLRDKFIRIAKAMGITRNLGSLVLNIQRSWPGSMMGDEQVRQAIGRWAAGSLADMYYADLLRAQRGESVQEQTNPAVALRMAKAQFRIVQDNASRGQFKTMLEAWGRTKLALGKIAIDLVPSGLAGMIRRLDPVMRKAQEPDANWTEVIQAIRPFGLYLNGIRIDEARAGEALIALKWQQIKEDPPIYWARPLAATRSKNRGLVYEVGLNVQTGNWDANVSFGGGKPVTRLGSRGTKEGAFEICEDHFDRSKLWSVKTEARRMSRATREALRPVIKAEVRRHLKRQREQVDRDRPVAAISIINSKTLGVLPPASDKEHNQLANKLSMAGYKVMLRFVPVGTPVTLSGDMDQAFEEIKEQYRKIGQSF